MAAELGLQNPGGAGSTLPRARLRGTVLAARAVLCTDSLLFGLLLGGARDRRAEFLVLSARVLARLVAGRAHVLLPIHEVRLRLAVDPTLVARDRSGGLDLAISPEVVVPLRHALRHGPLAREAVVEMDRVACGENHFL
eukprot:CAMPEP_0180154804 /NCGR_PEP_ID=MMETSP0986-20121125/24398_1 /TAXON_ID=697907 /ORGANISM="non described non described, Strain CCMP2293" /LENGTH=138 /DNA_ID=CAMNT_0022103271 /DNA_START=125 /DNA_END=541 /DNA_ORIENTATION=-